jgi:hypothetical protein
MVMAKSQPFVLLCNPKVSEHLKAIELKYHSMIRAAIAEQLIFEPERET